MPPVHHSACCLCDHPKLSLFMTCQDHSVSNESYDLYRCDNCGFVLTQDAPDEKSIGKYYQFEDYISHSNTRKGLIYKLYHTARSWMLGRKRRAIRRITDPQEKTLLDIGCGTGYFLDHMKTHGWQVAGIERDAGARAFSKKNFDLNVHPPDELFKMGKNRFSVITLWHVLEHVHNLDGYLNRIHELLKEDGVLVLALPNYQSVDAAHYRPFWAAYDVPRHLWHFSPESVEQLANRFRFPIMKKICMPLDAFYVSMLSEKYRENKLSLISGFCIGTVSYLISLFNINRCSSIIYMLKKKTDAR